MKIPLKATLGKYAGVLVALAVWMIVLGVSESRFWKSLEYRGFDWLTVHSAPGESRLPIVIVGIDDASMAELNVRWPWPRSLHARLIDRLREAGAAVIAMDVIFDHPTTPEDDAAMEQAVARAGNIVLAAARFAQETPQGMLWQRTDPIPPLIQAGAKPGLVNIEFDSDQIVRHFPQAGESFWKEVLFRVREAVPSLEFDPTLKSDSMIRYVGPDHSFPYIPYYKALEIGKSVPKDALQGALVLVGRETQAAADIGSAQVDVFATPFTAVTGRLTPGVEILATFIDNSVNRSSIREIPLWGRGVILLLVSLWCALVPWRFRPLWCAGSALIVSIAVAGASAALFVNSSWWLPVFSTVAVAAGIYAIQGAFAYVVELRNKARIREAFSLFVPAAVADSLAAQSTALTPGGEEKELTVLFTDLAGFTTSAEGLRPAQVARLLNVYFETMTDIVFRHKGTVQGYIGDALMAFWGAPLPDEAHAVNAVAAAEEMIAARDAINRDLKNEGLPTVSTRVGVHTGLTIVGNIGSKVRFNYTAIGDTTNLASRLEGLNKRYGTWLIISGDTLAKQPDRKRFRGIERVRVKGRDKPVEVYTPCDDPWLVEKGDSAIDLFRARRWDEADALWREVQERYSDDPIAAYYRSRIAAFATEPPPPEWDGIESISEK